MSHTNHLEGNLDALCLTTYSEFWESVAGRSYGNLYQLPINVERKPDAVH